MVELKQKNTLELSLAEKHGLIDLFNQIFNKNRTLAEFDNQYKNNALGYSFHIYLVDQDEIVGSISRIPGYYWVNGIKLIFTNGVDAMVQKKYRDFFYYYDMVKALDDFAKKEGAVLDYSFPNDLANPLILKAKIAEKIGRLRTYCLPYRIGGVKPTFKAFNLFTVIFSWFWIYLMAIISSAKETTFLIQKDAETFNISRYKRMDANYSIVIENKLRFVYKIIYYEGIRTAFLIDVAAKSPRNFNKAIRYIVKNHHSEFDILLYVGYLPFWCSGLVEVPHWFEPKNFNFVTTIFDHSKITKSDILNIQNWDVNLSNFDLI
jgi:hypothetical protein